MEVIEQGDRIKKANRIESPLKLLSPDFHSFNSSNVKINLKCTKVKKLDETTREWCFDLFKRNMKSIYEKSKSGYDEKEKREEMFDCALAYYLIAYEEKSNKPVAYSHFRFDMDYESEVIYCYELHVEPEMRKLGLGKYLMQILEELCECLELEKVVLTCSKYNTNGLRFFKETLEYTRDETDLNDEDPSVDYEILSKIFWQEEDYEEDENEDS
jgi:ribosomal protein S18 acetylase RimI-like enzyme